jgi:isoleucyl-tRNA synthetase
VRQPLAMLKLKVESKKLSDEYLDLIKDELNVKEIILEPKTSDLEPNLELDTNITPDLKQEGDYRELVRALQDMRKKMGLTPSDVVSIVFETNDVGKRLIQKFETDLKKTVLASEIKFERNAGEEIKIDELVFKVKIAKI